MANALQALAALFTGGVQGYQQQKAQDDQDRQWATSMIGQIAPNFEHPEALIPLMMGLRSGKIKSSDLFKQSKTPYQDPSTLSPHLPSLSMNAPTFSGASGLSPGVSLPVPPQGAMPPAAAPTSPASQAASTAGPAVSAIPPGGGNAPDLGVPRGSVLGPAAQGASAPSLPTASAPGRLAQAMEGAGLPQGMTTPRPGDFAPPSMKSVPQTNFQQYMRPAGRPLRVVQHEQQLEDEQRQFAQQVKLSDLTGQHALEREKLAEEFRQGLQAQRNTAAMNLAQYKGSLQSNNPMQRMIGQAYTSVFGKAYESHFQLSGDPVAAEIVADREASLAVRRVQGALGIIAPGGGASSAVGVGGGPDTATPASAPMGATPGAAPDGAAASLSDYLLKIPGSKGNTPVPGEYGDVPSGLQSLLQAAQDALAQRQDQGQGAMAPIPTLKGAQTKEADAGTTLKNAQATAIPAKTAQGQQRADAVTSRAATAAANQVSQAAWRKAMIPVMQSKAVSQRLVANAQASLDQKIGAVKEYLATLEGPLQQTKLEIEAYKATHPAAAADSQMHALEKKIEQESDYVLATKKKFFNTPPSQQPALWGEINKGQAGLEAARSDFARLQAKHANSGAQAPVAPVLPTYRGGSLPSVPGAGTKGGRSAMVGKMKVELLSDGTRRVTAPGAPPETFATIDAMKSRFGGTPWAGQAGNWWNAVR